MLLAKLPAPAATVEVTVLGSDGRPLPETVVFLESRQAAAAAHPLPAIEIAQVERRFVPRVTVVTTGTAVSFPNRDTVRHHVYSFSPVKPFELKLYAGTPATPESFDKPGIAVLGCNIHDAMVAWVVAVETPHFAIAGAHGTLRLDMVPPGHYRLRSWHAGLPPGTAAATEALVVPAGGARVQVKLPLTAAAP
ncbi:MAG: methylamine utilization protein [Leptothrix sp. (in: Bacteria)]|nr:methylamine utilization protein [Leptothrix sp. (in: b-proteobacteria)]